MLGFVIELKERNTTLFYFGLLCLLLSLAFLVMSRVSNVQVYQVNAWYKPFKFAFSTFLFAWAMAWYCYYLPNFNITVFNWSVILLLGFEIAYIAFMAAQGKQSHYNISTPFYSVMFSMMALAATLVTIYTAYVGMLFFTQSVPNLPNYYLWGIRLGILIFVIFSFQGFLMGGRMSHTVGLVNDNSKLFLVGWSRLAGDLRIAHFIGMHALQVLPLLAFYLLRNSKATLLVGLLYGALATFTLVQALQGRPLFPEKKLPHLAEKSNKLMERP
ncbi:MAG: hypothetical protein JJU34_15475 [Lunatimonas sp.]|uniref:hypothetical protein n=1 Tax=Lunatimonas sp. TaxID=2060141 RepID=UPI00263AC55C|nr:hypothetical protein [Lunatimonas sp.]MCC5938680.1 hypothetical protein [Lunatimonas sp.]